MLVISMRSPAAGRRRVMNRFGFECVPSWRSRLNCESVWTPTVRIASLLGADGKVDGAVLTLHSAFDPRSS